MTVSLPTSLPATPAAPKAGGSAAKTAGPTPATAPADGADHTEVSDMFAALVAALTQQMQPAAAPRNTAGEQTTAASDAAAAAVPAAATGGEVVALPSAVGVTADLATELSSGVPGDTPDAAAVDADGELLAVPTPGTGEQAMADAADEAEALDAAATKRPAAPGSEARATRPTVPSATPATPAQPGPPGAAAVPATPATPPPPVDTVTPDGRQLAGVGGPAPAPVTAAPVDGPATVAAPPAPAPDPHVQIARIVRPLRLGDDGAYELALDLTPAELGRVRIDVELRGSTINLHLRADNPATRELLQASLEQLRTELEAAGLQSGSLDVGARGSSDRPSSDADDSSAVLSPGDDSVVADPRDRAPSAVTDTSDGVNVLA